MKACDNFTFSEVLARQKTNEITKIPDEIKDVENDPKTMKSPIPEIPSKIDINLIESLKKSGIKSIDLKQIETAFQMVANIDTGQVLLSRFLDSVRKIDPTFDYRNFGYNSFKKFCEALSPLYELVLQKDKTTMSLQKKRSL